MDEQQIVFEFGGFRVDPVRRMLYGADGQPIHLKPKAFNTLLHLIKRPHELIERHALLKAVWPNVVVDENSLSQVISQLRHALGEHPGDHRYIVTESGRGYRFVAPINRVIDGEPRTEAASRPSGGSNGFSEYPLTPDTTAHSTTRATADRAFRVRWSLLTAVAMAALVLLAAAVFVAFGRG
jgi:DNA-binding winged helix-turn-helix (wHTH) protein